MLSVHVVHWLPHHRHRSWGVIMVVACNGSVQVGERVECDRQMANFLSNLWRPLILPHMLCALIRHIAGLWSSHCRQHISSKNNYIKEDLSEKHHIKSKGFGTQNKLMLKTLFQMLLWALSYSDNYPNHVYRSLPNTLQPPKGIEHWTVQQSFYHLL